ncbi:MAG: FAD-dependent oxidoreductase [Lachnospiraceae bacterium]|nr:FAD-dependent oxidoreductase [Lachnospiraceae bacterium]
MSKYSKMFSPLLLPDAGVILKNRMEVAPSSPVFIQGPEPYPAERMIRHYAHLAETGAGLITVHLITWDGKPLPATTENVVLSGHLAGMDLFDTRCSHYFAQLAEAVHFYGSKIIVRVTVHGPDGYGIANTPSRYIPHNMTHPHMEKEMTKEMLEESVAQLVKVCKKLKEYGFDGVFLHAAYRMTLLGRALSPADNKRTDEFGGSLENRCRFPFYACDEIKKACGKDFIIEMSISGEDPTEEGKWTLDDTVRFMEMAQGKVDILQPRVWEIDHTSIIGYDPNPRPFAYMAAAAKKANSTVVVSAVNGFLDPDASEATLENDEADLIAMARGWICNPDYGTKLLNDKADEIVPCIRCNKCLLASNDAIPVSVCSVNPRFCLEDRLDSMIPKNPIKRKVAVVGGGPAGMEAALSALEQGHDVTLYEKSDSLGGLLKIATVADFKWPLRDFKNYLVNKTLKSDVKLCLNTEATPEGLKKEGYDVVITAIGAHPIIPPAFRTGGKNVITAAEAYLHPEKVGKKVVVVGGGEVGVETALYFNGLGSETTIIEMQEMLMPLTSFEHYYYMIECEWESRDHFHIMVNTAVNAVTENGVECTTDGEKSFVEADTIILSIGYKPDVNEVMAFADSATRFFQVGDCLKARSVQTAMREGFSVGSTL